ncbi:MAG: hypothetical protein GQ570_06470 [Helicobacteraceae bacterium]|nr:hypothetical protein [Helicobacteraceae bacterium]
MIELEYIVAIISLLLIYVIYQNMVKTSKDARHIRSLALAVENLNREFYALEKKVNKFTEEIEITSSVNITHADIQQHVQQAITDMAQPIAASLENVEENINEFNEFKENITRRLDSMETGMKSFSMPSSVNGSMDDDKIISLYQQSKSAELVAKELRLSQAEVEFVLKVHKIK